MSWIKSLLIVCALSPAFAQTTASFSYNGLPLPVLTSSADTVTIANIYVPRTIKVTNLTVQLQIEYPNTGDLRVYLFSPLGTRTILTEHDCSIANIDTTFDDSASSQWKNFCPTEAGRGPFRSDQPLSNFYGDDSSFGIWQLTVQNDQSQSRTGWVTSVTLNITGNPLSAPIARPGTIVNAANVRQQGTIAPGELVSIYGIALGPSTAVAAPSGDLPTSLDGSSVMVNGAAAPIAYASTFRVDFQAPFSLTAGSNATVQATYNGQSTSGLQVPVIATAPAIYTESVDGTGQVRAANQDGSMNSTTSPAAKGSTIVMYATGLGAANPQIPAGTAPPSSPLSTVSGVTATIGGVNAPVSFAGLAPTLPGLYQLNIQIPSTASSGPDELIVYVSNQSSQKGVLVQVQ